MSNPDIPASQPPRRSRIRSVLVGSALILFGVVIGIGTTAVSQDYYGRGWFDGPRWHDGDRRGFRDDDDRGHGRRWFHHGGRFGGMGGPFLTPGRIERIVDRLVARVDGSSEQKQKINAILRGVADDLYPLRQQHLEGRRQLRDVLAAPTIDRAKLEALRVQQMQLADAASKRLTEAIADVGDVLTPPQRAELAKRFDDHAR
jgi:Spy/CpxP family protein refolding chaperone